MENPQAPPGHAPGAPYVIEHGKLRSLHFNRAEIQSVMWIARPDALYLQYTRLMMGFLMFVPQPRAIAMIGLGGGSMAKFCHRHLPHTRMIAVELDAEVIALRDIFEVPQDDDRWQVVEGDGADFVVDSADAAFDVLIVDGFGGDGVPPALSSQGFYDHCQRVLDAGGVLVTNLHEAAEDFDLQIERIRRSFAATVEVREGERGNCIVFAGSMGFAAALRHAAVRRPEDLDRDAWTQLKPAFARILGAVRLAHTGDLLSLWRSVLP